MMVSAPAAQATFPGQNGKIAFVRGGDIWAMNPDGTGQANLTSSAATDSAPDWSPDGQKIAFTSYASGGSLQIWVMHADGTNPHTISDGTAQDSNPAWDPTGAEIAFSNYAIWKMNADGTGRTHICCDSEDPNDVDWSPGGGRIAFDLTRDFLQIRTDIATVNPNGTGFTNLTGFEQPCDEFFGIIHSSPSWSPDEQLIAFDSNSPCNDGAHPFAIWIIKPDGTGLQKLTNPSTAQAENDFSPTWSPDGSKIAFSRSSRIETMTANGTGIIDITDGDQPDWQPIPINAYPRPRGATPLRLPLVPAQKPCTTPNKTHGAPLSFGSCSPTALSSQYLTTGTPDANGRGAHMDSYLLLSVLTGDVEIDARLTDVMNKGLSDYTGSLHANLPLRITDKNNTPTPSGPGAATTQPFAYGVDIPCTTNGSPIGGSNCTLSTTVNALTPGAVQASLRAIWQIGQARVFDGGSDGDGSTGADNTVFAVQGVFIP
jgi:WD40 repeat protein